MKYLVTFLVLFATIIATPAAAKVIGTKQVASGVTVTYTDNREAPDIGFVLTGCGTLPGSGQAACAWVPMASASQAAVPQPAVAQDVSEKGNPLVGNAKPDTQVACQTTADSYRCVTVEKKPGALAWIATIGSIAVEGLSATRGYGYSNSRQIVGPFYPGGSRGGQPRQ